MVLSHVEQLRYGSGDGQAEGRNSEISADEAFRLDKAMVAVKRTEYGAWTFTEKVGISRTDSS